MAEIYTNSCICAIILPLYTIIGKFGEDVKTYAYSLSLFKAEVEVATSHVFYSWVFGFGGRVIIKGPESVKREYVKVAAAHV